MEKEGKIDSVIGKETAIKGDLNINGSMKVDGSIEGNIDIKESLFAGRGSFIKGKVTCHSAIVGGKIEGDIDAQELLEFQTGAQMFGDISCKGLIVQEGVFFEGNCRMSQKAKEKT
jgi:cytoskeletal protein CcmA (bactofilin family)